MGKRMLGFDICKNIKMTLYSPINAYSGQKQPDNFDEILQVKA